VIRVGLVGCDTSHVVEFTKRLNHLAIGEDQWVNGAGVVAAWSGPSQVTPQEAIDQYVSTLQGFGVEMLARPEGLIGRIDAVMVEAQAGGSHPQLVIPFLEAGLPCFVDKPFACSVEDARAMADRAMKTGAPLFSSSSLRYALEIQETLADEAIGTIVGAHAYSPAALHPVNPGLFHYGIHAVEALYALMGPGCESVSCTFSEDGEVTSGLWRDGRLGTVRGTRRGAHAYGFIAWGERSVRASAIDAGPIYCELLKRVVAMFETRQAPIDLGQTVEIVSFIEAARRSAGNGGARMALE
jgi:virulence factor